MKLYWLVLLSFSLISAGAHADDTEIYLGNPNAQTTKPNIIFIFDTSGSMGNEVMETEEYQVEIKERQCDWRGRNCIDVGTGVFETKTRQVGTGKTRLELTQNAAIDTINDLSGVNLALMRFNGRLGGYFSQPMKSIDDSTHKSKVVSNIRNYNANGATPLVESVNEAYLYYTGGNVIFGNDKEVCTGWGSNRVCTINALNHADTFSGSGSNATYISPITESCQKNHIVLFTDGASTSDGASDTSIRELLRDNFSESDLVGTTLSTLSDNQCSTNDTSTEGLKTDTSCLKDLAYAMNRVDAAKWITDSTQTVQFHAIGGFIGGNLQSTLDSAASLSGGISANAQNYDELKEKLQSLFDNIVQSGGTFAAPAVSVNAFNSLEQLDQMYYSVFKPHENVGWSGNVKRFRMAGNKIVDAKGNSAIDESTGFFSATAQSYWTPDNLAPDGDNITKGGMASRFQDDRKVVSNISGNNLMDSGNRIRPSNTNVTKAVMGTKLTDASFNGTDINPEDPDPGHSDPYSTNEFTKLVQWVGGMNSKFDATKSRKTMEDPLHSSPVLLNYGELTIDGKKVPDSTLFIGTNSGYLHAFDTNENNPKERFAFIPKELLPVATKYYENSGKKKYGLDGHISVWHNDTNKDMIINGSEKAYLYVGMRRGGSSYYALDVSDRDNPKLLWQINGKNFQNGPTTGFEELGQSWSKMLPVDIKWGGVKKKALLFAGGYDTAEDSRLTRAAHSIGNAIYMVDATTGALLWKASPNSSANLKLTGMTSAITGDIVPVDDNSDGYVDLLYVADLGGRIWRIDFNQNATIANSYATGGMIADLGKNSSQSEHVRFYHSLDVVYSKAFSYIEGSGADRVVINDKPRYMLSIGSGYRAHPLDNSASDNFYVVFDYNTNGPAKDATGKPTYTSVNKADLQDYTFGASSDLSITPTVKSNKGLYVKLKSASAGEKVLSSSLTLDNTIYFTSFRPSTGTASSSCTSDTGKSRLYSISLNIDANGKAKSSIKDLNVPGIPPKPVLIIPKGDPDDPNSPHEDPKLLISTEIVDTLGSKYPLKKTYWREFD